MSCCNPTDTVVVRYPREVEVILEYLYDSTYDKTVTGFTVIHSVLTSIKIDFLTEKGCRDKKLSRRGFSFVLSLQCTFVI